MAARKSAPKEPVFNAKGERIPGIYKRGSRYLFVYKANGRQHWESARTLTEAKRRKRARQAAIDSGEFFAASRKMFREYAEEWIDRYRGRGGRGFREQTREDYRRDLRRYIFPFFDERHRRRLSQITPPDVGRFIDWLCDEKEQGRRLAEEKRARQAEKKGVMPHTLPLDEDLVENGLYLADATVARILSPLRACLATAMKEGLIRTNPTTGAELPRRDEQRAIEAGVDEDPEEKAKAFSREQLGAFLRVCRSDWLTFFRLLANTGMRVSEALALRWRDLELDGSSPRVRVRRRYVKGHFGPPKSKHGRRAIPLEHALVIELRQRRKASEWPGANDLVFPSSNGQPMHQENLRRRVLKPAAEEADAAWAGFHTFRHTFASLHIAAGTNIVQLSRMLGHHSPEFTLRVYAHLIPGDEIRPLDLAAELGNGPRVPTPVPTEPASTGRDAAPAAENGSGTDRAWDGNGAEPAETEAARS